MKNARTCFARTLLVTGMAVPFALAAPAVAQEEMDHSAHAGHAEPLPPAEEILASYVEAIGGREEILAHTSIHTTGTVEMPTMGMSGTVEGFSAAPDKMFVRMNLAGMGETMQGYDGTVGWTMSAMQGPALAQGEQLAQMQEQSDFYAANFRLHDPADYRSIETVEHTEMGGENCYKIKLVHDSGREFFECYDVETGLLVGMANTVESPMGAIEVTVLMSGYEEFGGVLVPTEMVQEMGPQRMVFTTESVEFDAVDPAVFALPPEIQTLVDTAGS